MKVLFVVQGEGRGHLTQAIALEDILLRNGHEVVMVMVGKSPHRQLPSFFTQHIQAPVVRFESPNFLPTAKDKRASLFKSVAYNIWRLPAYLRSIRLLGRSIRESKADLIVNFYEILVSFTYFISRPSAPYVCIGHQYLFLHPDFVLPKGKPFQLRMLLLFTRLTSLRASKRLALSFYPMKNDERQKIVVVPPLLRKEVFSIRPHKGDFILGYMVNNGFAAEVREYHSLHPNVVLHFFWDKVCSAQESHHDVTLTFHPLDDKLFLRCMSHCKAYASTAGFESICEAMLMGKPVLMVPAHIEQDCNALDARRTGAGIISDSFQLDRLMICAETYQTNVDFKCWVYGAELRFQLVFDELSLLDMGDKKCVRTVHTGSLGHSSVCS